MKLNELTPTAGSRKSRKRLGCGMGSGHGKTSGRGHKGQKSRSGGKVARGFEGGQMPLIRRVPKRGFVRVDRVEVFGINVGRLEALFDAGAEVTPEVLHARGRVQALEREQQALIKRNRELAAEIKRLQTDDAYLEELARKKYGLLRENEMVYEFGSKKTGNKNRKSD